MTSKPKPTPYAAETKPAPEASCSSSSSSSSSPSDASASTPTNPLNLDASDCQCPYRVLGVSRTASAADIKGAYKKRALQTHPDRGSAADKNIREAMFKLVSEAYELLSDASSRYAYDTTGSCSSSGSSFSTPPDDWYRHAASESSYAPNPSHTHFGTSPDDGSRFAFSWEAPWDTARRARAQAFQNRGRRPMPTPGGFGFGGFGFGFEGSTDPFSMFNAMFEKDFGGGGAAGVGTGNSTAARSVFDDAHPAWDNHRKMADTKGFGWGFGPQQPMSGTGGFGFSGGFVGAGSTPARDPFASMMKVPDRSGGSTSTTSFSSSSSSSSTATKRGFTTCETHSATTRCVNGVVEKVERSVKDGVETIRITSPAGEATYVDGRLTAKRGDVGSVEASNAGGFALPGARY